MKTWIFASLFGVVVAIGADLRAADVPAWAQHMLALTPEDFERTASVKDDALEVVATITTQRGYQERHGLLQLVGSDNFLRAFIDKTSGATTYQLYQKIVYDSRVYKYFDTANYQTAAGPRSVRVIDLGRTEECTRTGLFRSCTRTESVAVPIDEALLATLAAKYTPGVAAGWFFRFKAQSGDDYDGMMSPAEVAGLLAKVADYKREHGLAKPGA